MAVLSGLTSTDGGMVAAATMSLPERARANRNYDYRYAWIRDQCYAGQAVAVHGHFPLLDAAVSFVSARLLADGPHAEAGLHGRRRRGPRRAGAFAPGRLPRGQRQGGQLGQPAVPTRRLRRGPRAAGGRVVAGSARHRALGRRRDRGRRHRAPLAGTRRRDLGARQSTLGPFPPDLCLGAACHRQGSAGIAIGPLERAGRRDPGRRGAGLPAPRRAVAAGARGPADRCGPAVAGHPPRACGLGPAHHRPRSTRWSPSCSDDDYVYRFAHDARPLGEAEGAFLLCGFLLALALEQQGDHLRGAGPLRAQSHARAAPRACWPRSSTSPNASSGATCPRRSSMPCCSSAAPPSSPRTLQHTQNGVDATHGHHEKSHSSPEPRPGWAGPPRSNWRGTASTWRCWPGAKRVWPRRRPRWSRRVPGR